MQVGKEQKYGKKKKALRLQWEIKNIKKLCWKVWLGFQWTCQVMRSSPEDEKETASDYTLSFSGNHNVKMVVG